MTAYGFRQSLYRFSHSVLEETAVGGSSFSVGMTAKNKISQYRHFSLIKTFSSWPVICDPKVTAIAKYYCGLTKSLCQLHITRSFISSIKLLQIDTTCALVFMMSIKPTVITPCCWKMARQELTDCFWVAIPHNTNHWSNCLKGFKPQIQEKVLHVTSCRSC